ncbi:UvrD-helicase domain-containing protein [Streptomyces palmae]|uniref:DNA 3'-5' helicase n=1 Tax=Streptomyces palmae TaxID=1701085 RepID=A0A4Z0H6I0_9ACTN|nr:UvrD-helicase domain-containing protein [Streptomyces palmae]TGB08313.1 ATP-dependent helicase [Streptomyces palmae]
MAPRITDPEQLKELLGIPFTPEQTACITAPLAPQVIVAGAGSGKTTVMAARVVWLVGTGQVAPEQVLGLTFTNKAAGELAERVRTALVRAGVTPETADLDPDRAEGEPRISTYHAFAGQLLKDHGLRVGLEPTARLLADATRFQLAARVLRGAPGPYPALTRPFADLVTDLLALDGELSEHLVPPDRLRAHDTALLTELSGVKLTNEALRKVPETARARLELLELVESYRAEKRGRDLLDFGDQIALSATLALERPEVGRLLRQEFAVVLLDEYQDTSVAQRLLLAGLFGKGSDPGGAPGEGTGHPVTAVGDPCQAIYGWRGASVANLDDFPEHFPHPDGRPARRHALSENRRSGGRLLALANTLAAPLRARHAGVEALRPAPGAEGDGLVRCALLPTHAEELAWLADHIAHLVRTGTPAGEIAVLCRTATDFAEIQGALVERDVPVEVVGLSGLLHLPEVADLVAVCEVLQDPSANAALVRLLTGPRWRIGPRDLALLGRRARLLVRHRTDDGPDDDPDRRLAEAVEGVDPAELISLADALDTFLTSGATGGEDDGLPFSSEARVRFARLAAELRELRRALGDPLLDVLHRVLAVTGLEVELSASPHALAARRRETLRNFLDVAADFAALDGEATLLAFLGFLRTAVQYEKGLDNALPGGEDTVKVLTAHKSKGLEWDVVAVPGLVARQFPSEQAREAWTSSAKVLPHALRGDAATLPDVQEWHSKGMAAFREEMKEHQRTEELRLGYVTFTRPRSLLLGSGHWWGPTQKKPRGPSDFLQALRAHCESGAGHGEVEVWADAPEDGAENPALHAAATADRTWPLPLDPDALARRRRAAEAVFRYLNGADGVDGAVPAGRTGRAGSPAPVAGGPEARPEHRAPADRPAPAGLGDLPDDLWPEEHAPAEDDAWRQEHAPADEDLWPEEHAPAEEDAWLDEHTPAEDPWPEEDTWPGEDPWGEEETGLDAESQGGGAPAADTPPGQRPGATVDRLARHPYPESAEGTRGPAPDGATVPAPRRPLTDAAPDEGLPTDSVPPADAPYDDEPPSDGAPRGGRVEAGTASRAGRPDDGGLPTDSVPLAGTPHDAGLPTGSAPPADAMAPGRDPLVPEEARLVESWDRDLDALAGELRRARATVREVPLPAVLSASQLLRLAADPDGFAQELARPMPRPPQPAARRGTRFHAWVESRFEELPLPLLGPDELPGGAEDEPEIADERDLAALKEAFARTPYAQRTPYRVEAPFHLLLAGRMIRGRIDAVYRERGPAGDRYEIVDWKTGRSFDGDPLQLAIYRLAWAEQRGVPLSAVDAGFLYVRSGELVRPSGLPDRAELERILTGEADG